MDAYKMAVANVARYIRSSENRSSENRYGEPDLDAFTAAHVLAKAFAKMNGEVLQDIINVDHHDDLHARAVKMREG